MLRNTKGRHLTCSPSDGAAEEDEGKHWNKSEQAMRFHHEQQNLSKSRQLKRTSHLQGHRVERSYYMCGTPVRMDYRYQVDQNELERLKELSRTRGNRYYGRGLSDYGATTHDNGYPDNVDEVPRQPPPSSLGHAEPFDGHDGEGEQPADVPTPRGEQPSPGPGGVKQTAFLTQDNEEEEGADVQKARPVSGKTEDSISLPDVHLQDEITDNEQQQINGQGQQQGNEEGQQEGNDEGQQQQSNEEEQQQQSNKEEQQESNGEEQQQEVTTDQQQQQQEQKVTEEDRNTEDVTEDNEQVNDASEQLPEEGTDNAERIEAGDNEITKETIEEGTMVKEDNANELNHDGIDNTENKEEDPR